MGGGWVEDMVCTKSNMTEIQTQKFISYTYWKNKVTDSETYVWRIYKAVVRGACELVLILPLAI